MIEKQITFDTVVAHARQQGRRAEDNGSFSLPFKSEDGCMCFAGCLIPEYRPSMDELCGRLRGEANLEIAKAGHNKELVGDLILVHDCNLPIGWEIEFERIAKRHKLTYTPPGVTP